MNERERALVPGWNREVALMVGFGLLALGGTISSPWGVLVSGAGLVVGGVGAIASRGDISRMWGPAARARVRPITWHWWLAGGLLVIGGLTLIAIAIVRLIHHAAIVVL